METIIPLPLIPHVDLAGGITPFHEGLTREQLGFLGCVYLTVGDDEVEKVLGFLQRHVSILAYVNAANISTLDSILSILDAGAHTVFVQPSRINELKSYGGRVALATSQYETNFSPNNGHGVLVDSKEDPIVRESTLKRYAESKASPIFLYLSSEDDIEDCTRQAQDYSAILIIRATKLTVNNDSENGRISVPAIISSSWVSDRSDHLIPTLVTNERGIALGLVYSNRESLSESLKSGQGVYQSRKRGLWYKGATSGDTQELVRVSLDCDQDCLRFVVKQKGRGFCHLSQYTCFGEYNGISKLEKTLESRKVSAPEGSYTARLFSDEKLLRAKIMEEAEELCNAKAKDDIAFEAADLLYFALTKAVSAGVSFSDIERSLDAKSAKVKRRQGDAKGQWAEREGITNMEPSSSFKPKDIAEVAKNTAPVTLGKDDLTSLKHERIQMRRYYTAETPILALKEALQRPSQRSSETIMGIVNPIIKDIRTRGDTALLEYTHRFEKATSLTSPVIIAPFPQHLMDLPKETIDAIDLSFDNIRKFHSAQMDDKPLRVETMPGVVCSRFARPIERVGLYIPGGTAVLPSTALMLGVPAMVAGCKKIIIASPPRADGSITPEIVYVAHKVGAESIVLAGGAQAIAAMAYGTESVTKVDKILGPGNQFVTAAKMYVSNDTNANVSIDMPAGPSEVLVIADRHAKPAFVASDLLSQAEHGIDSQVILIAISLSDAELKAIEDELHSQAMALPRVDIVKGAIEHSITLVVRDLEEAMKFCNEYAPEHLILQIKDAADAVDLVDNAGSVFIGDWTPESVGDYSAGVNHSLPTYGYAKQYSGVNLASFVKYITSSNLTAQGLRNVGGAVMQLAKVEELEAHRRAVSIRLKYMNDHNL